MRRLITASAALFALAGAAVALAAPAPGQQQQQQQQHQPTRTLTAHKAVLNQQAIRYYSKEIVRFQKQTWHWQRVMGERPFPAPRRALSQHSVPAIVQAAALWRKRSDAAYRRAKRPPHLAEFLCIHRHEGSWTDTGDPYWGGLQMDISFQRTYGGYLFMKKGTADRWSPLEQIWAAERAHRSRGFYPWPNTARYCGLI